MYSKTQKYPKECEEPPEDFSFDDNPLFKYMSISLRDHLKPEDLKKVAYHMTQVSGSQ